MAETTFGLAPAEPIHTSRWRHVDLVVVWACALIWGFGALTITHGFLYNLYGDVGLVKRAAPLGMAPTQGFVAMMAGPTVLGVWLSRNWRAVLGALLALVLSLMTPVLWYLSTSAALNLARSWPDLWDLDLVMQALTEWIPFLASQWIVTVLVVSVVAWINFKPGREFSQWRRGIVASLGLTFVSALVLIAIRQAAIRWWDALLAYYWGAGHQNSFVLFLTMEYSQNVLSFLLWQIPPLVWTTTFLFLRRREQPWSHRRLTLWAILVLFTLMLPILFYWLAPLLYPLAPFIRLYLRS